MMGAFTFLSTCLAYLSLFNYLICLCGLTDEIYQIILKTYMHINLQYYKLKYLNYFEYELTSLYKTITFMFIFY